MKSTTQLISKNTKLKKNKTLSLLPLYIRSLSKLNALFAAIMFWMNVNVRNKKITEPINIVMVMILIGVGHSARKKDVQYPKKKISINKYSLAQTFVFRYIQIINTISIGGIGLSNILSFAVLFDKLGELVTLAPIKNKELIRTILQYFGIFIGAIASYFTIKVFKRYQADTNLHYLDEIYHTGINKKHLLKAITPMLLSATAFGIFSFFSSRHGAIKLNNFVFGIINFIASRFNKKIHTEPTLNWLNSYVTKFFGSFSFIAGFSSELVFCRYFLEVVEGNKRILPQWNKEDGYRNYVKYFLMIAYLLFSAFQYSSAFSSIYLDSRNKETVDELSLVELIVYIFIFIVAGFGGACTAMPNSYRAFNQQKEKYFQNTAYGTTRTSSRLSTFSRNDDSDSSSEEEDLESNNYNDTALRNSSWCSLSRCTIL